MHNDNLHKINEYLLLVSFCFQSHPFALLPAFLSASRTRRNVTNLTKRKRKRIKNNKYTQIVYGIQIVSPNLKSITCFRSDIIPISLMQHFRLHQKGGASVRKELNTTNGKNRTPSQRIACFLNELRQPVVKTPCRHICNGRVESFLLQSLSW